jgi:hypothetical protein
VGAPAFLAGAVTGTGRNRACRAAFRPSRSAPGSVRARPEAAEAVGLGWGVGSNLAGGRPSGIASAVQASMPPETSMVEPNSAALCEGSARRVRGLRGLTGPAANRTWRRSAARAAARSASTSSTRAGSRVLSSSRRPNRSSSTRSTMRRLRSVTDPEPDRALQGRSVRCGVVVAFRGSAATAPHAAPRCPSCCCSRPLRRGRSPRPLSSGCGTS